MGKTKEKNDSRGPVEQIFEMFTSSAMKPRRYIAKPLPNSVTVGIRPEYMEILHVIASRIGTSRANAATHILEMGIVEAAAGCGFTIDEDGKISDDQKKWDTTPRPMGFSFNPSDEEAA
jgi:hypothetical protein